MTSSCSTVCQLKFEKGLEWNNFGIENVFLTTKLFNYCLSLNLNGTEYEVQILHSPMAFVTVRLMCKDKVTLCDQLDLNRIHSTSKSR